MPLPLPSLDNRTFDQLVVEGQVLLPRHAPLWTDYNAHDPGITVLELLAWLAEMRFYRLDRTPSSSYRAFLRLAGVQPHPRTVAESLVVVGLKAPAVVDRVVRDSRIENADGRIRFQTVDDTSIVAARLVSVLTGRSGCVTDRSQDLSAGASFEAFSSTPSVDDAVYVGFDIALPNTPSPLALYISTGHDAEDHAVRRRLEAEYLSARAETPDEIPDWRLHYDACVIWEYHAGGGRWTPLERVDDETRALTLSGFVRFTVPPSPAHAASSLDAAGQAARFFIRCRLAAGRFDCPPRTRVLLLNAVRVVHAADVDAARVLTTHGTGRAAQSFSLGDAPLVPGAIRVEVILHGAADTQWREVPTWDDVGPHDRAFIVSYERGEIAFGDGRIGRVPPADADIRATYKVGGGSSGNVPSRTLTRIAGSPHEVLQPFDAFGGADDEELDAAIGRALTALAVPTRLVTLEDAEALALSVPGVPIARAHAIADYDPTLACLPALGSMTVVVVPPCPRPRPEPTQALLCAVARFLERRRPLTTQLHVVGPSYVVVSVRARLHPLPDADVRGLADAAHAALDRFLDPLDGGEHGTGWPVGRPVYRSEVMALLNDLPGVRYVDELSLQIGEGAVGQESADRCRNVPVCCHGLVVPGTHHLTIASRSDCQ